MSRANAVYSGLQSYQYNINTQISDNIDQVNKLGDTIQDLNLQIMKVEAGGIETAMTLRDARDQALDEPVLPRGYFLQRDSRRHRESQH